MQLVRKYDKEWRTKDAVDTKLMVSAYTYAYSMQFTYFSCSSYWSCLNIMSVLKTRIIFLYGVNNGGVHENSIIICILIWPVGHDRK